jgi:hypothetical protein
MLKSNGFPELGKIFTVDGSDPLRLEDARDEAWSNNYEASKSQGDPPESEIRFIPTAFSSGLEKVLMGILGELQETKDRLSNLEADLDYANVANH